VLGLDQLCKGHIRQVPIADSTTTIGRVLKATVPNAESTHESSCTQGPWYFLGVTQNQLSSISGVVQGTEMLNLLSPFSSYRNDRTQQYKSRKATKSSQLQA
jgi:hypothetical protein